ncbi:MAG: hypothetical protein M1813_001301, partial [Trichoglossum hirsutum]
MRQTRSATGPLPEIDHQAALQAMSRPSVQGKYRRRKLITTQRRMWRSTRKAFLFFSLPPELRQMVIRELFSVGNISTVKWRKIKPKSMANFSRRPNGVVLFPALGLLFSCRRAYEEVRCVLYGDNRFVLWPCDIDVVPSFLDNIGHANRMAMVTTIRLRRVDVGGKGWWNFCALASEMPLHTLDVEAYSAESLESSIGATWVKYLARISSLKYLFLSFFTTLGIFHSNPHQPLQRFLNHLQKELERTKGKVLHQELAEGIPIPSVRGGSKFISHTETTMRLTSKFTLNIEYYYQSA